MRFLLLAFLEFLLGQVELNQTLSDLNIQDFKGQTVNVNGKFTIFEWTNFKCPYVRKHYDSKNMQKLQEKAAAEGFLWITVLSSAPGKEGYLKPEEVEQTLQKEDWKGSHFVLDSDGTLGKKFGAKTTPHIFILNDNSQVIYKGAIDSIRSTKQSDIEKAENYVLKVLQQLKEGNFMPFETKPYGCSVKYGGWW